MTENPTVEILMSTYNGENYLHEQLNSILKQTYQNWVLKIADDGSSDATLNIIEDYARLYPTKMMFLGKNKTNLGPCQSFAALLAQANAEYIMFCDQDDIWLPQKVSSILDQIRTAEKLYGKNCPLLIHTDLKIVNDKHEPLADSFWKQGHLKPSKAYSLNRLIIQNYVTGCTVLINRSLKNHAPHIPKDAFMHDWWLALIAISFGKIFSMPESFILYRLHQNNNMGISETSLIARLKIACRYKAYIGKVRLYLLNSTIQSKAFLNMYGEHLSYEQKKILDEYSQIPSQGFLKKRLNIIRNCFFPHGLLGTIKILLAV